MAENHAIGGSWFATSLPSTCKAGEPAFARRFPRAQKGDWTYGKITNREIR